MNMNNINRLSQMNATTRQAAAFVRTLLLGMAAPSFLFSSLVQSEAPRYQGRGIAGDWRAVGNDIRSATYRYGAER